MNTKTIDSKNICKFVDNATIFQLAECLHRGQYDQYDWSIKSAHLLTSLLINENNFQIAPSPTLETDPGTYFDDQVFSALWDLKAIWKFEGPSHQIHTYASELSTNWINIDENVLQLRQSVINTMEDNPNFDSWIEWVFKYGWPSHIYRFKSLFEEQKVELIAKILGVTPSELERLRQVTGDYKNVLALKRNAPKDVDTIIFAYLAAAKLRGNYHDHITCLMGNRILQHPLRLTKDDQFAKPQAIDPENSEAQSHFANIILFGALEQKTFKKRLETWVNGISVIRKNKESLDDLRIEISGEPALNLAINVARKLNIQIVDTKKDTQYARIWAIGKDVIVWGLDALSYVEKCLPAKLGSKIAEKYIPDSVEGLANRFEYISLRKELPGIAAGKYWLKG